MTKLAKYLKSSAGLVVAIVALLFLQAHCKKGICISKNGGHRCFQLMGKASHQLPLGLIYCRKALDLFFYFSRHLVKAFPNLRKLCITLSWNFYIVVSF